jgi:hypothetical protein
VGGGEREKERHGALVSMLVVFIIILVDIIIRLDFDCFAEFSSSSSGSRR